MKPCWRLLVLLRLTADNRSGRRVRLPFPALANTLLLLAALTLCAHSSRAAKPSAACGALYATATVHTGLAATFGGGSQRFACQRSGYAFPVLRVGAPWRRTSQAAAIGCSA